MNEQRATLQAAIVPLANQSSVLRSTVSALNREAGRSEQAVAYQKQEIASWYTAVASALSAQTGLELEILSEGSADKRKKLAISVRTFYTCAPSDVTGVDDGSAMDLEIPMDEPGSAEPVQKEARHMLTVTCDASGTELAEITMSPSDVPIEDLVTHAVRTNCLRFFVRELRARVGNYYCRRDEIDALQVRQAAGSPRCPIAVREESDGMVSMQLPNVSHTPSSRHLRHIFSVPRAFC